MIHIRYSQLAEDVGKMIAEVLLKHAWPSRGSQSHSNLLIGLWAIESLQPRRAKRLLRLILRGSGIM